MSILKSTRSGKFTPLTIEYMLTHGWHHPFLVQYRNEEIRKKDELVRDEGKHGRFLVIRPTERTPKDKTPYLRAILFLPIRGCYDYQYRVIAKPKTIHDLEMIVKLFDLEYVHIQDHRKPNKIWGMISELYGSDFCEFEVTLK